MTYIYFLKNSINQKLDLRPYANDIASIVRSFGGENVSVYRRGYKFECDEPISNGQKRALGRKITRIHGLGKQVQTYHYTNRSGKHKGEKAKSNQLFRRKK